jgi:cytoskeletal protein CcmA (bactofilin family)
MSLFARKNDEPGAIDSSSAVEDVTHPSTEQRPIATEIPVEAEDVEANGRIGKGSRVSGKLEFAGSARIYGEVEGQIVAGEAVIIRRGAQVNAKIHANEVVIEGDVTADVQATGRVEIGATGRLRGTVSAPRLILHDGAIFDGSCSMTGTTEVEALPSKVDTAEELPDAEALSLAS